MPVSGLVVTLTPPPPQGGEGVDLLDETVRLIRNHPNFQIGEPVNRRLPVVVDTPDTETDKQCWRWLNDLPGVYHVDVAFIHFEDPEMFESPACGSPAVIPGPTIGAT